MIILTGATGTVGSHVARELSSRGVACRAITRDPDRATALAELSGVALQRCDLAKVEALSSAFAGGTVLFLLSAPGPEMSKLEANAIDAAKTAGIERIVKLSAIGASADSPTRLMRLHAESEAALQASGMAYTIVRPHSFMQNTLGFAQTIATQNAFYSSLGDAKLALIDARDVASAVTECLIGTRGAEHEGRVYEITGPESLSFGEVAAVLSDALSRTVSYVPVSTEQAREALLGIGMPPWLTDAILELDDYFSKGHGDRTTDTLASLISRAPRSYREFVGDHHSIFDR